MDYYLRSSTKMKFGKIALLVFCFNFPASPQAPEKPEQIDQFARPTCEELAARSQNFASQISNDPSSKGAVIVQTLKGRRNIVQRQFRMIIAYLAYSNAEDRVQFILNPDADVEVWELWKIPSGAVEPAYKGERWIPPTPNLSKAFIYGIEDENGICPTFAPTKYAELILRNPGARAHIVIYSGGKFSMGRRDFARQWIDSLTTEYALPRNKIKIYYARGNGGLTYAEFWFVPPRKK